MIYQVTIRTSYGNMTLEVHTDDSVTDDELLDIALEEIKQDLDSAKLDSYHKIESS